MKYKIGILASGKGTTLTALCNAVNYNILNVNIKCILTNNSNLKSIGEKFNIPTTVMPFNAQTDDRYEYNNRLYQYLKIYKLDMVVLAGWNFIVNKDFIKNFDLVLNLHPALPNSFIGQNCIRKAYDAFKRGEITYTGSMVHIVTDKLDRGEVINSIEIPIYSKDTYQELENRVKESEKGLLVQAIQTYVNAHNSLLIKKSNNPKPYIGKVRTVEDIGYNCLLLTASDRLSAFDKFICNIKNKGVILNNISSWWFKNTNHIIKNHYLYSKENHMIVRKTQPIKLEIIVRAYMTGSTNTSIWTMYKNNKRCIYGLNFRDGYVKNQLLDNLIITPTTKGETDHPITYSEILDNGYLTKPELDFIYEKSVELFKFGQRVADSKGLILVDTKYEFGKYNGEIILIDELHTCDSSRYWIKDSYESRFNSGEEPIKLDKDAIRDWIKQKCDPYRESIPTIPESIISNVEDVYKKYNTMLTNSDNLDEKSELDIVNHYFKNCHKQMVIIFAGSIKDKEHVETLNKHLKDIYTLNYYISAHKNTREVLKVLDEFEEQDRQIIYVTVAGRSNALSGVVASNTKYPTMACPPFKDKLDMQTNINSTLMCPSKVPVMTILEPENVAIAINKIFKLMI